MGKRITSILFLSAAVVAVSLTSTSVEAKKYGMAGCGLGSQVIKTNDTMQIFAATTNGIAYNQTIGITIGTSNCTADGVVKQDKVQELFVTMNYDSLGQEMASGKGEKLESLGNLLGCSNDSISRFGQVTKENYAKLITEDSTPASLLSAVKSEVKSDKILAKSCSQI
ncbi:DUF3015 domain-containing protein [Leptospira mtsangambouensis]|uniref:DUF3015 domain-containing protein n=1 Tax=Leptospira mtsangambouensis TaxID=2484912 RepID=UPI001EECC500|nr:DUF3015 domain-containing protein [Leptospira mtsangambouensis]MCG6139403.1 DUF3015 domain-containing protein [Leptospira mtsangambouensis]